MLRCSLPFHQSIAYGHKDHIMTAFQKKAAAFLAAIGTALVLSACGGGGGGAAVTLPTATDSISVTGMSPSSAATVSVTQSLTVTYTSTTALTGATGALVCGTTAVPVTAAIAATSVVFSHSVSMPYGSTCSFTGTLTASGVSASGSVSFQTEAKVYHYTELRLAINLIPKTAVLITTAGAVALVNNTGHSAPPGGNVFNNCSIYEQKLPDGRPIVSCELPFAGFVRKIFPVNPETLSLDPEYVGVVPSAALHDVPYGTYGTGPYLAQGIGSPFGMDITTTEGIYYVTDSDHSLRLTTNGFVSNSSIGGQVQYLTMFSN
jgi:hypothetical protein